MVIERPRWVEGSGPRIGHALLLVVLLAATRLLGFLLLDRVTDGAGLASIDARTFALFLAVSVLSVGGVIWLGLLRWGRLSLSDLGWSTERLGPDVLWGIAGGVALCAIVLGLMLGAGAGATEVLTAWASAPIAERLLIALVGIEAAFTEESLFRGDLQPSLQARLGRWSGLALCAVVFAVYHLRFSPWGLAGKTIFGVLFGLLRMRTGRLVAPAVAHWISWAVMGFH